MVAIMLMEGIMLMGMILDKELKRRMWDAMLLQLAQPTLVNVFQLSKYIKMNMVEE
jgi:hypothetical protein